MKYNTSKKQSENNLIAQIFKQSEGNFSNSS